MRSFTANTPQGTARVQFPEGQPPRIMLAGRQVAQGWPTEVDGPALDFGAGWVVEPRQQTEARVATLVRTSPDAEPLADVAVTRAASWLKVDGLPTVWGKWVERVNRIEGWTFDGEPERVVWQVELVALPGKKCCGRR